MSVVVFETLGVFHMCINAPIVPVISSMARSVIDPRPVIIAVLAII